MISVYAAPASVYSCPGDRVVYADRWQGTLDTPSAPDRYAAPELDDFEPTDADWDDMARWSEHVDRLDEMRRDEDAAEAEAESRARYGL